VGLFDKLTGKDDLADLERQLHIEMKVFETEIKPLVQELNDQIREFNGHINLINNIRHNTFALLKKLHQFLSQLGNTSILPSPFDFKLEHTLNMPKLDEGIFDEAQDFQEEVSASSPNGKWGYIFKGPFWAGFEDWQRNKKFILDGEKHLGQLKVEIEKEKTSLNLRLKTVKEAIKIAEIYRVSVYSVMESIEETILPELQVVRSFLLAESVKNRIVAKRTIQDVQPESIALLANTLYHNYYLFVQNSLLYYTMLVEFFKSPILTEFLKDNQVTEQEKDDFKHHVQLINTQIKSLRDLASF